MRRALATTATLAFLAASAASAAPAPAPAAAPGAPFEALMRPGQTRAQFRNAVLDARASDGRIARARAMSASAGSILETGLAALRLRARLRDHAREGIEASAVPAGLGADADGDGRVTEAEFNAAAKASLSKALDGIGAGPTEVEPDESDLPAALAAFDAADADHDHVLSGPEITAYRARR